VRTRDRAEKLWRQNGFYIGKDEKIFLMLAVVCHEVMTEQTIKTLK
jgi:hypothetical protein